ncbi:MAG TPA: sulfotransferase [Pilimelia sp.]|nr:sulfotransferase [Pilimelia sp.]
MLKVIGAGLPRTGTTSTKAALERLGFNPCYHMLEVISHPAYVDHWAPLADGAAPDWETTFAGYRAAVDWPASHYWRELAAAYPDAKVVLTVRDPATWYPSMRMLMAGPPPLPGGASPADLPEPARSALGGLRRMEPLLNLMGRSHFGPQWRYGTDMDDEAAAVAAFTRHADTVRAALPADRLLVFDVRQGWEPLCDFLGVPVPEEPFPHLNDSATMRQVLTEMVTHGRMPAMQ